MNKHRRRLALLKKLAAVGITVALASAGVAPAYAIPTSHGAGFLSSTGTWLGVEVVYNGVNYYCVDRRSARHDNGDDTVSEGVVTSWAQFDGAAVALPADTLAKINFAVSQFGQTSDAVTAAAVQLFAWKYGDPNLDKSIDSLADRAGSSKGAVLAKLAEIEAAAAGITAAPVTTGSGTLTFQVDRTNNYKGTVTVTTTPTNATGTITLTNGIFVSTGTNTITGAVNGTVLDVVGVPPADGLPYKISGSAQFDAVVGYAGNVEIVRDSKAGGQEMAGPGTLSRVSFQVVGEDPTSRATKFNPVLTTTVNAKFTDAGSAPVDKVTFGTAPDASGLNNPWYQDAASGLYVSVTAKATYYWSATKPVQGAVPAGAEIAGHATITTTTADGPTVAYTVTGDTPITKPGYYTWVYEIAGADQKAPTTFVVDSAYSFVDEYGQIIETTHVAPVVSTTAKPLQGLGLPVTDTVHVEGAVVEGLKVVTSLYMQQIDASTGAPTGDPVCDENTLVFTATDIPVTAAGDYLSEQFIPTAVGKYFWQEVLVDTATGAVVSKATCGVAGETSEIKQVLVTTTATPSIVAGGLAKDTALITGTILPASQLVFKAYKQASATSAPQCAEANLVYTSPGLGLTPGVVNGVSYESPAATFANTGNYFWVESIVDTISGKVYHEGVCGETLERTTVTPAPATSTSVEKTKAAGTRLASGGYRAVLASTGGYDMSTPAGLLIGLLFLAGLAFVTTRRRALNS